MSSAVVVLTGLAVLDRIFTVDTLPVAAGKHFARTHREIVGGIAANAALAIVRLGGVARLVTRVGADAAGDTLRRQLEDAGVDVGATATVSGAATPVSAVFVDALGERLIVNHKNAGLFAATPDFDLGEADAVMADLRWPAATAALLDAARALGIPALLDVDQAPERDAVPLEAATHLVFGADALGALSGTGDPASGLERAACRAPRAALAVTCGGAGIHWRLPEGTNGHIAAHDVAVVDTLGAGDVFHGAAALALAEGRPFEGALVFANAVAAVKVTRPSDLDHLPRRDEAEALLL